MAQWPLGCTTSRRIPTTGRCSYLRSDGTVKIVLPHFGSRLSQTRDFMMMKSLLFAVALLSLALWTGCATGGGGHPPDKIVVKLSTPSGQNVVGVTLSLQFTATVTNTDNHAVTWSLTQSGAACTAACGSLSATGLYTAPSTPPTPAKVDITATSVVNPAKSDKITITVFPIIVSITP